MLKDAQQANSKFGSGRGEPMPEPAMAEQPDKADQPATGEEQQSYEEGMREVQTILYENEQASDALISGVQEGDKVGSAVKTVVLMVSQIDEKIDLDESVIYSVTVESVDRLLELVETSKGIEFSNNEVQKIMMGSWEGVLGVFGGDEDMSESYEALAAGYSDEEIKAGQQQYQEIRRG